jgi:hypothetical protein
MRIEVERPIVGKTKGGMVATWPPVDNSGYCRRLLDRYAERQVAEASEIREDLRDRLVAIRED